MGRINAIVPIFPYCFIGQYLCCGVPARDCTGQRFGRRRLEVVNTQFNSLGKSTSRLRHRFRAAYTISVPDLGGPNLMDFGSASVDFGFTDGRFGAIFGRNRAKFCRIRASCGRSEVNFGRCRATLGRAHEVGCVVRCGVDPVTLWGFGADSGSA